jgi:hypothetical protein
MYFASFPIIPYDSVGNGHYKYVTNLLRRVGLRAKIKSNTLLFDTYDIRSGETPEEIADKLYDDPELHWVVLMVNNITDRYHQWPLNENQFQAYINDKYDNIDAVHHYETAQTSGDTTIKIDVGTVNTDYPAATAITNYEYELAQENEKRGIRLLDPRYLGAFIEEFELLMGEDFS